MLTGERLQYLADLLPENVSWGDPLNAVMLNQILAAHSAEPKGLSEEQREALEYALYALRQMTSIRSDEAREVISALFAKGE